MSEAHDPTARFSDRAGIYARCRPGYPVAAGEVLREIGNPAWIAEMAAGTGLFTRTLLAAGQQVVALEPNAEMRSEAERELKGSVHVRPGTAEDTGLDSGSVPMIVAAQAFHWFDRERTRAEWQRILVPDGWVALVRNVRDAESAPKQWEGHRELTQTFRLDSRPHPPYESDAESVRGFMRVTGRFLFAHKDVLDWDQALGRMLSFSAMPLPGNPAYSAAEGAIRAWFDAFCIDGKLHWPMRTNILVGKIAPR